MQLLTLNRIKLSEVLFVSVLIELTTENSAKLPKFCIQDKEHQCETRLNTERVICRGSIKYHKDHWPAKSVLLCSWSQVYINPEEILNSFPFVRKLTIQNGNVSEFLTNFPRSQYLQSLILVDLNISEVRSELFSLLENLKVLDLSRNRLKRFSPEIIKTHPSLLKVILTDNPWDCSEDLSWILDKSINSKIHNKKLLQCGDTHYPGKPVHRVQLLIKKMKKDCPEDICSCKMNNIVWNTEQIYLIPVITVNCSDKNLAEMPKKIPLNTTTLLLSRNNISNLTPLIYNKIYNNIADIYLDHNKVKSVDVLEGIPWLKKFRVLNLRGNELTQLPIYALDNAFEKNSKVAKVYLGLNPWKCDCLFVPEFQHLLIKYGPVIKDKNDIRCSEGDDHDNSNRKIISLSTNSVCRKLHGINPLDVLSAVFASLIILILGKLIYDYWTFKKTGKLPWIVTRMPLLPGINKVSYRLQS